MDVFENNAFLPLTAAGLYTILLLISFTRRDQQERQATWLLFFLVISITWEFFLFFARGITYPPNLPAKILLAGTTLLGVTTAVFVNWSTKRLWLLFGSGAIAATLLLDITMPTQMVDIPYVGRSITYSNLATSLIWIVLSGAILGRTWRDYRRTTFPWHANRLLYWVIVLLLTFAGEALLFFQYTGLTLAGQFVRLLGVMGLTYAATSHRIFDVRTRSQSVITSTLITIISALPFAGTILLTQWLTRDQRTSTAFSTMIAAIAASFFLYLPFRRFIEHAALNLLRGEGIDTNQVLRHYSHSIYQILDVQQLSQLVINTLDDLLGTKQGALMLVTRVENGYEIESVSALTDKICLSDDCLFLKYLTQLHQPLLQYEIDFNRDYVGISQATREWLKQLAMDVYVPVSTGIVIDGLIAAGPKKSGVPYQPNELDLMQILADQTVVALQNARLYSELGQQNAKIHRLNQDLTHQNERLAIMDRVKSDFITIASHELRTPLTQVKGYTDFLKSLNERNDLTREQIHDLTEHIGQASDRMEGLISAMLDASQLDTDGFQMLFTETNLEVIIRMAAEPLTAALTERHITWQTQGLDDLPPIFADFQRLVQAFTNLIGNAIKYTPDYGSVSLQAEFAASHDETGDYIEIVLEDRGIGIDAKFHDLIFEKFFRVDDPQLHSTGNTKFKGAGPGLGLPIAKGVIEGHGGRIWVESDGEDEEWLPGARFHIVLPVRPPRMDELNRTLLAERPDYLVG